MPYKWTSVIQTLKKRWNLSKRNEDNSPGVNLQNWNKTVHRTRHQSNYMLIISKYTVRHKLSITCLFCCVISQPLNGFLFSMHPQKINVPSTDFLKQNEKDVGFQNKNFYIIQLYVFFLFFFLFFLSQVCVLTFDLVCLLRFSSKRNIVKQVTETMLPLISFENFISKHVTTTRYYALELKLASSPKMPRFRRRLYSHWFALLLLLFW